MERAGIKILIITTVLTGVLTTPVLAQVMTSTNFKMQQDSINFGGGYATSENFGMEDTAGEVATGYSESDSFVLHAGYQQMKIAYISLTVPVSTKLLPSISGLTGGTATGSSFAQVTTDNDFGYVLQLNASSSPAMRHIVSSTYHFSDYPISGGVPSLIWDIDQSTSAFGFTPEGSDVVTKYLDDGDDCNATGGNSSEEKCWGPLSQTPESIAISEYSNHPTGSTTTIHFKAESGNQHLQVSGKYQAQIVITAFMN